MIRIIKYISTAKVTSIPNKFAHVLWNKSIFKKLKLETFFEAQKKPSLMSFMT